MKSRVFKLNPMISLILGLRPLLFTLVVAALILAGLRQAEEVNSAEGLRLLEEAILRAAVHSYAVAGYFPDSLDYITETYGIFIDQERFLVHYEVFATNLLPYIRVFDLGR